MSRAGRYLEKFESFVDGTKKIFFIAKCKCPLQTNLCNCGKIPDNLKHFIFDQHNDRTLSIPVVEDPSETEVFTIQPSLPLTVDVTYQPTPSDLQDDTPMDVAHTSTESHYSPRYSIQKFAMMCDRLGVTSRVASCLASALFEDIGWRDEHGRTIVCDKNKVDRERRKLRADVLRRGKTGCLKAFSFDGRKDDALTQIKFGETYYSEMKKESHLVVVQEPNNQLLGYVNLAGKNDSAEAKHGALKEFFEEKQIPLDNLIGICSDGEVTNTGEGRGILRRFEKQLNRALHWWICLLHFNELPFRHLYETLEKSRSTGPRTSTGSLDKDLQNCHTQQVNNGSWDLPESLCDFYIGMDVSCSTSSIMNLVAISRDRYIAVTQPIKYAKYKNTRRVCLTIMAAWASSIAIAAPIMVGINDTPDRVPHVCAFYNTYYILVSSVVSFYIPCFLMGYLYWSIFKALRDRARKQHQALRKPHQSELTGGSVIENVAQTSRLAETALDGGRHAARIIPDEPATNTASGSNEEEEDVGGGAISPDIDDCHVIVNDKSTEFMLATVVEETGNVVAQISSPPQLVVADPNGNHDSGYAPSNVDDVLTGTAADSSPPDSPEPSGTLKRSSVSSSRRNTATGDSPTKKEPALSVAMKPLAYVRYGVQEAMTLVRNDSTLSATSKTSSRKDKKGSQASRFTIYKVHKASKKKREKVSARKERKATKTLAIVLGVFLICWMPFFICNVLDAVGAILKKDCRPGMKVFIFTTWLGYINSFINPVIYTIFNPEFRKAFKKIMCIG